VSYLVGQLCTRPYLGSEELTMVIVIMIYKGTSMNASKSDRDIDSIEYEQLNHLAVAS